MSRAAALAILFAVGTCLATTAAGQQGQGEHRLRLGDRIGRVDHYRLAFDLEMRAEYSGSGAMDEATRRLLAVLSQGMDVRTAVEYEQRLADVAPDETHIFEVRWHDYQFQGRLGDEEIPPPPGHASARRELLSGTARVKTTPTAETLDVSYSSPSMVPLARQFHQAGMPTFLPATPVRVGDSWTGRASLPLQTGIGGPESMEFELEHTLREVREGPDGPIAVIALSGSYTREESIEAMELGLPLHMEASFTGVSLFAIAEGRFVGGSYELDMFALHSTGAAEVELTGHANGRLELVEAP
ncbi:MAG: hypothetical protein GWN99_14755 [Gemmatimonadetes bacterium]|uniref:Uncharacterized protein n=1 Tax=Candidatus Kutchimonas denitrificans TaxID=3056748 RepID=A0AAE4Z9X3_9BACT|nr:hypothetical protein [Gemmatimonadota bacterium]NIR76283.1 hypothetical protein [Candidatus Kutchimonas denitrificans]NIS02306.1 hypothetical protein [Gemmatimonadota bacterium]NIT68125.1 hypothetical protein [Gemmatimonadota bacterium]NIU54349.1 hypothetical protein [Gemmatimonadota bacterium]